MAQRRQDRLLVFHRSLGDEPRIYEIRTNYINHMKTWITETVGSIVSSYSHPVVFDYHGVLDRPESKAEEEASDNDIVRRKLASLTSHDIQPVIVSWVGHSGGKDIQFREQWAEGIYDDYLLIVVQCNRNHNAQVIKGKQRIAIALSIPIHIDDGIDHLTLLDDEDSPTFRRILYEDLERILGNESKGIRKSKSKSKSWREIESYAENCNSWEELLGLL